MNDCENFPESGNSELIEKYEHLLGGLKYSIINDGIEVFPHKNIEKFHLSLKQLDVLNDKLLLYDIPFVKYYSHYGFSLADYGEFFIGSDVSALYEIYGGINHIDIRFQIGNSRIEFSRVSSLCTLLLEPYFSKKAYFISDRGLSEYFCTLKIFNTEQELHKDLVLKSLFYINSRFLAGIEMKYGVIQVIPDGYDDSITYDRTEEYEVSLESKSNKLKNLAHVEPLYLYNDACIQSESNQFLGFYRVLEFFFDRGVESTLKNMRKNANVSDTEIINFVRGKDERKLLKGLLDYVLSEEEKANIANLAFKNKMIDKNLFEKLPEKLYEYRCAIAHARESQKDSIILPDIFFENRDRKVWTDIVRMCSELVINKLNTK